MSNKATSVIRSAKKKELIWRYVSNLGPTLGYAAGVNKGLNPVEKRLALQLDERGIAVTTIDDVLEPSQSNELYEAVEGLLAKKATEILDLKHNSAKEGSIGSKTFNLELLGGEPTFESKSPFVSVALTKSFLNIANAYFRMFAKLRYYNVWYTAASSTKSRESQLWHFDREDNYILKVFLYLDDVDEGSGPFTYAPGTHKKGQYRSIRPEYFLEGRVPRTTDDQMKAVFPEEKWIRGTGKKGTIIFADTRGYHKGGEARTKDRLMYTCMYTSPASESRNLIKFGENFERSDLDSQQLRALGVK